MGKLNWNKAKKFREIELKYEPGTILNSTGMPLAAPKMDSLAKRAKKAEAKFLREMRMDSFHQRGHK